MPAAGWRAQQRCCRCRDDLGSRDAVDRLVAAMRAAGVAIARGPRVTGDGYYEAVVSDTEGNLVEITA